MSNRRSALSLHFFSAIFGVALAGLGCSSNESAVPGGVDAGSPETAPPCVAVAAASEVVRVDNELGPLEGTLLVPDGCGPMPVVLVLSGSGSTDRDGNVPHDTKKPDIYRVFAETLRDAGFAVLRYDDPGVGKSARSVPMNPGDFRFEMEIKAAALFVAKLRTDARFGAVIAAGHSQGSTTGIMVAQQQPIDGFISLAGPGRPVGQVLHEQMEPKLTTTDLATLDAALAKLERGEIPGPLPPPLDQVLPVEVQPYFVSWMKVDPKAEIAKLKAPALLLQGQMDIQIRELDARLLAEGKSDAKVVLVDDMGHMLRQVTEKSSAAQQASYSEPLPMHPAAVAAITEFLTSLPVPR